MIDFPASPTTGQLFTSGALSYRYDGHAWLGTPPAGVMTIPDAPNDGVVYGRQSQAWVPVSASGGGGVWIGDTAPTDTTKYPFWWSSASLQLSIWYNDGNSSQWVDTNGAPSSPPGAWLLQDGTVTAPGLAWANEPGLGWYRKSTSVIGVAAQGSEAVELDASGAGTYITAYTKSNAGAQLRLFNNAPGAASFNYLNLYLNPDGKAGLVTNGVGGAARGTFGLDAAQILFNDGTVAAPGISFASEPGLGWYRPQAGRISMASNGVRVCYVDTSATSSAISLVPRTSGQAGIYIGNQPDSNPNYNFLAIQQNADGSAAISGGTGGTATAKVLTMTFPAGIAVNTSGALSINGAANAQLVLNAAVNNTPLISALKNGQSRWQILLGDGSPESGGNVGSNFYIQSENDAGAYLSNVVQIVRSTSTVNFAGPCYAPSFNPSSDERMKDRIAPLTVQHDEFMGIVPISYIWKDNEHDTKTHWGFSAQNLAVVAPRAYVKGDEYDAMDPVAIQAMTVLEVQDLITRVRALEAKP